MSSRFRGALVASTLVLSLLLALAVSSSRVAAEIETSGTCSGQNVTLPFADVPGGSLFFCAIASGYFSGLVNGTSATAYNPSGVVTRDQMAAFVLRTQDSAVKRSSRRAAAGVWATPKILGAIKFTSLEVGVGVPTFDGEDIWVTDTFGAVLVRIHASDGRFVDAKAGTVNASSTIAAAGDIYAVGRSVPGHLYRLDPSFSSAAVVDVASNLGGNPSGITFDGASLWTADMGTGPGFGSISRYSFSNGNVTSFAVGFDQPIGIVFDGTHLWVVDQHAGSLLRVDPSNGAVIETVPLGNITPSISRPVFDGSNVWVPVTNALKVVRTSTPAVLLATLTGNGLSEIGSAAFDGERVLVAAATASGTGAVQSALSLWKASSLAPLGSVSLGDLSVIGVASDGLHFWISLNQGASGGFLARF